MRTLISKFLLLTIFLGIDNSLIFAQDLRPFQCERIVENIENNLSIIRERRNYYSSKKTLFIGDSIAISKIFKRQIRNARGYLGSLEALNCHDHLGLNEELNSLEKDLTNIRNRINTSNVENQQQGGSASIEPLPLPLPDQDSIGSDNNPPVASTRIDHGRFVAGQNRIGDVNNPVSTNNNYQDSLKFRLYNFSNSVHLERLYEIESGRVYERVPILGKDADKVTDHYEISLDNKGTFVVKGAFVVNLDNSYSYWTRVTDNHLIQRKFNQAYIQSLRTSSYNDELGLFRDEIFQFSGVYEGIDEENPPTQLIFAGKKIPRYVVALCSYEVLDNSLGRGVTEIYVKDYNGESNQMWSDIVFPTINEKGWLLYENKKIKSKFSLNYPPASLCRYSSSRRHDNIANSRFSYTYDRGSKKYHTEIGLHIGPQIKLIFLEDQKKKIERTLSIYPYLREIDTFSARITNLKPNAKYYEFDMEFTIPDLAGQIKVLKISGVLAERVFPGVSDKVPSQLAVPPE